MWWYVSITDYNGITFYIKTNSLEYLLAVTEVSKCKEIRAQREADVNVNIYTDLDTARKLGKQI